MKRRPKKSRRLDYQRQDDDELYYERSALIEADSLNQAERSFSCVVSDESPTRVYDPRQDRMIVEILRSDGCVLPKQTPLLDDHRASGISSVLGAARNWNAKGDQVIARGFLDDDQAEELASRAWKKISKKFVTDVSPRYRSATYVDIEANRTATVKTKSGPVEYTAGPEGLRVTTKWIPKELSLTPIGANDKAKIRSERKPATMNKKLRKYLESIGMRSEATDAEAWQFLSGLKGDQQRSAAELITGGGRKKKATLPPDPDPAREDDDDEDKDRDDDDDEDQERSDEDDDPKEEQDFLSRRNSAGRLKLQGVNAAEIGRKAVKAERKRQAEIRELAGTMVSEEVIRSAIEEDLSPEEASRKFLREISVLRGGDSGAVGHHPPAIHSNDRDSNVRALAVGFMHRLGLTSYIENRQADPGTTADVLRRGGAPNNRPRLFDGYREFGERLVEKDLDAGDRYRNISMLDICREACLIEGKRFNRHDYEDIVRTAVSTTSLSAIFSTSIHARLLQSYEEQMDTSDWCSEEDVVNFQTQERASLGKTAALVKLPRGSTAEHASIGDSKETFKIARYAKQFVVDEQDLIDDNLGGINEMPNEMGRAAARLRPDLVYSILLANAALNADSIALFNSAHNNTATSTLDLTNLPTIVTKMYQQTQDGVRLDLRPAFLIVNPSLEWKGREILTSAQIVITTTADQNARGTRNVLQDLNLQLRVEGRLDANGVTDPDSGTAYVGSATTWFLASSNNRGVRVAYRTGTGRRPQLRRFTLDKGQWGIGWDINHDIGAKALDYRPLQRGNT